MKWNMRLNVIWQVQEDEALCVGNEAVMGDLGISGDKTRSKALSY